MVDIEGNIQAVRERIRRAAAKCGRAVEDITLVAVTKTHPPEIISEAVRCGITDIGENRVQDAVRKHEILGEIARWHFIGHLQRNKVRHVLKFTNIVHSVESLSLAEELQKRTENPIDIFVEVNVGEETSKSGVFTDDVPDFVKEIASFSMLNCKGLMALPPWMDDPEDVRPYFRTLAELQKEINRIGIFDAPLTELSMGMTDDFDVAIEEGATIVRVGRAIFGPRQPLK